MNSPAQKQLASDLMRLVTSTPLHELEEAMLTVMRSKNVQCIEDKIWGQDELDKIDTGGSAHGSYDMSDAAFGIPAPNHEAQKKVTYYSRASEQTTDDALKNIGFPKPK